MNLRTLTLKCSAIAMAMLSTQAPAADVPITSVAASSQLWPASALIDGDVSTVWSSTAYATHHNEWLAYWFDGYHAINYIKLRPRFWQSVQGFPVAFDIYWSDGSNWQHITSKSNYLVSKDDWVVLPLPSVVQADGIYIGVTALGSDMYSNRVAQLAEVAAGYDPGFEQFKYLGNSGPSAPSEIRNVGSGSFNPSRMSNWNFDYRRPLIAANGPGNRNIYAPSIVYNWGTWNIYFGGWDGTYDGHDRISILTTNNNFQSFSPHYPMIDSGPYTHVNNASAIKLSEGDWRLYYTTAWNENNTNKPAVSVGTTGIDWSPSTATSAARLSMSGYPNWANADVNGSNVIYYENGTYHLYFTDFADFNGVYRATSADGVNFAYQGLAVAQSQFIVANDVKSFVHSGTRYYLGGFHFNGDHLLYGLSTTPTQFPSPSVLVNHRDSLDAAITSIAFVTDGNRLHGFLYGASPQPTTLVNEAIFAVWLQKKVIFQNADVRWGDSAVANGPDNVRITAGPAIETGNFSVYDTDGQTLLFTSPAVTIQPGDQWQYVP